MLTYPSRMKPETRLLRRSALVAGLGLAIGLAGAQQGASASQILPTPDCGLTMTNNCILADDFVVYSMGLLSYLNGDGAPNGNELFAIKSTPGEIKDDIVIGTGASGVGVMTNDDTLGLNNSDDAYPTPSGMGSPSAFLMGPTDPTGMPTGDNLRGPGAAIVNPATYVLHGGPSLDGTPPGDLKLWDIEVSALNTYLGSEQLAFWFNLNETNQDIGLAAGQDLLGYVDVHLTDFGGDGMPGTGDDVVKTYTFSGDGMAGDNGGVGNPLATPQTSGNGDTTDDDILPAGGDKWAYVHGALCVDGMVLLGSCSSNSAVGSDINQNLGSDLAAFALYSAMLDDDVKNGTNSGDGAWELLTVDGRLAHIDNGFEQFFIRKARIEEMMEELATISGFKVLDLNENAIDDGEEHLEGWTITLCDSMDCMGNTWMDITDANGFYEFLDLTPGDYWIFEDLMPGWTQIGTSDGLGTTFIQTTVAAGDIRTGQDFFNNRTPGVPEPGTLALFGIGLAGLGMMRRRKATAP